MATLANDGEHMQSMPVVFLAHGSPMVALAPGAYTAALERMRRTWPAPRAIVVVSAHWQAAVPLRVTSSERPSVLHDFAGFPEALFELDYPCPGDPELARGIVQLLGEAGVHAVLDAKRGLDHGAWLPLRFAYPSATTPVVQVSLGVPRDPRALVLLGQALQPLRARGVLLIGSGGIVHNLELVRFDDQHAPVDAWAQQFDEWVGERVAAHDLASLLEYRAQAPHAGRAVPTTEHLDPLFCILGARTDADRVADIYRGFHHGNLSMRCFALRS